METNEDLNPHDLCSSFELSSDTPKKADFGTVVSTQIENEPTILPIPTKCYPILQKELEKMYLSVISLFCIPKSHAFNFRKQEIQNFSWEFQESTIKILGNLINLIPIF